MATERTEQNIVSEDKGIVLDMSIRTISEFFAEGDEGLTKERRILDAAYTKAVNGDGAMLKLFIDKMYPNPKQAIGIESDSPIQIIINEEAIHADTKED